MDKLKRVLSGNDATPEESDGILPYVNEAPTLSWSTRIKAFCVCFVLGIALSLLGSFALFMHKGLATFAVFYTLGNILSMASTCFLMGPFNQMKKNVFIYSVGSNINCDWIIYLDISGSYCDSKELLEVEQALARRGLKDPWLRNKVWRYNVKQFGTTRGRLVTFLFRGLPLGVALTAATVAIEFALNKDDGHGHGHEGGHH